MTPWPYRIHGVMDHALVRFFERANVPGHDVAEVAHWIAQHRGALDDTGVLNLLSDSGIAVEYVRNAVRADADANKRRAIAMADGRFLIRGRYGPYVVSRGGYVITTRRLRRESESLLPLFGRWRELASA